MAVRDVRTGTGLGAFPRRRAPLATFGLCLLLTAVLAPPAFANLGDLAQKAEPDGCVTEDGSDGSAEAVCLDGRALPSPRSVEVSPDGANVYVATSANGVLVFDRNANGYLAQKPGTAGCIAYTPTPGCATGVALEETRSIALSPDGKSAYAVAATADAVSVFDRDPASGALTQKPGTAGCISETGTGGACVDGKGLDGAWSIAVSPDGESVYVGSIGSDAVAVFDRDPSTGALTQKADPDGCFTDAVTAGCTTAKSLADPDDVAVSADGENVYVAASASASNAIAVFDRDTSSGALTQKADPDGCVTDGSTAGCTSAKALSVPVSIAISPNDASLYAAAIGSNGVAVFDRDPSTGALTQKADPDGCITNFPTAGCTTGNALRGARAVAASDDGESLYVAGDVSDAIAVFDRDPSTGALTQKADPDGCFTAEATAGCTTGRGLSNVTAVTVAPGGSSVYSGSYGSRAVGIFDRDDEVPPETAILSGPLGATADASPRFAFGASDPGATLECRLDFAAWVACASPQVYPNLLDGPHTFRARGSDVFGNVDPSPAVRSFVVDTAVEGSVAARKKQRQGGKRVKAKLKVRAKESLTAEGTGKVKVKRQGKRKRGRRKSKVYRLQAVSKEVDPGGAKVLRMKVRKRRHNRKILKAIRKGRKVRAPISVQLTDELGNRFRIRRVIRLK